MHIRTATKADLTQLSQLFDGYRVFYRKTSNFTEAQKFLRERLENKDSEIFLCEMDDKVLSGFVQLYPLFSSTRMKKLWLLNDLFVRPEHRGKGVSVALIERAKKLVVDSDACGMFLETEKTNDIGNQLYPKTGFEINAASNYYEWSPK